MSRIPADGIRMDTAKHVPVGYFADSFVPGVRAVRGDAFLVAEYFDTGPVAQLDPLFHAGFDSAFHFPLHVKSPNWSYSASGPSCRPG